jgi:predicted DNA binding CopG/RHH family protein
MRRVEMGKEDKLEEEILASFERGEWQPVPKNKSEIARFAAMASAALAKDKRVNIRISSRDLDDIQAKAAEEAIPYQTLMASVLHKYVTGRLVEPQTSPTRQSTRTLRDKAAQRR